MAELDDLFAHIRAEPLVAPPKALMARVLQDADREQGARDRPKAALGMPNFFANPSRKQGFWAGLSGLFGGGGVIAGFGSVVMAGLYIGFAQPGAVVQWGETLLTDASSVENMDLMPGVDALLSEE